MDFACGADSKGLSEIWVLEPSRMQSCFAKAERVAKEDMERKGR